MRARASPEHHAAHCPSRALTWSLGGSSGRFGMALRAAASSCRSCPLPSPFGAIQARLTAAWRCRAGAFVLIRGAGCFWGPCRGLGARPRVPAEPEPSNTRRGPDAHRATPSFRRSSIGGKLVKILRRLARTGTAASSICDRACIGKQPYSGTSNLRQYHCIGRKRLAAGGKFLGLGEFFPKLVRNV